MSQNKSRFLELVCAKYFQHSDKKKKKKRKTKLSGNLEGSCALVPFVVMATCPLNMDFTGRIWKKARTVSTLSSFSTQRNVVT